MIVINITIEMFTEVLRVKISVSILKLFFFFEKPTQGSTDQLDEKKVLLKIVKFLGMVRHSTKASDGRVSF